MEPDIINLNSALDWTAETRELWQHTAWERIRVAMAPQIAADSWTNRRNELPLIGLVSALIIDALYSIPDWDDREPDNEQIDREDAWLRRLWIDRQAANRGEQCGNEPGTPGSGLTGHEHFFRPPRVGASGVLEAYGVYVEDVSVVLCRHGFADRVPERALHAPAVLLCPERLYEVYPTIVGLDETLRHPLPLAANPALASLQMTLLHELGHHFFPLHHDRQAGSFLCEAHANLFCHNGLSHHQQAWLLYKTWYLQPPEYSAYRPLQLLCAADPGCQPAIARGFSGALDDWDGLLCRDQHDFERELGAGRTMALVADAAGSSGLKNDLGRCFSHASHLFLGDFGHMLRLELSGRDGGSLPADLVDDLYSAVDLSPWVTRPGLPNRFWGPWRMGNEVAWPDDCLQTKAALPDWWIEMHRQTPYPWLRSKARKKLYLLRADRRVQDYVSRMLADPEARPSNCSLEEAILTLHWMLTVAIPASVAATGKGENLHHLMEDGGYDQDFHNISPSLGCGVSLDPSWLGPLSDFANKDLDKHPSDFKMTYERREYALALLRLIPGFEVRPALGQALSSAISTVIDSTADWLHRRLSIEFIASCVDHSAIPALEAVAGSTDEGWVAQRIREAAAEAITMIRAASPGGSRHCGDDVT